MPLLIPRKTYKPFEFPWAYEAWKTQQALHWLPDEVPLGDDVKDWHYNLTDAERHLLTQVFRFFTQADVDVGSAYCKQYMQIFQPTEVMMMLMAFANIESIHIAAYSHLLDTVGMPETEYEAFIHYKAMREKHEYVQAFNMDSPRDIALTLAVFSGFTEGVQLFASFAILLSFPRRGLMKGMGQIITWSQRDESLHVVSMIRLLKQFISEHPAVWTSELKQAIYAICTKMVELEKAFVATCFELGDIEGITQHDVCAYVEYLANRRLVQLGLEPHYTGVDKNPLPWLDEMMNAIEHSNFFEARSTEYSKSSTIGSWDEAFAAHIDGTPA